MGLQPLVDAMLPRLVDINNYLGNGLTCLAVAASSNNVALVRKLLELGAHVDLPRQEKQLTPLHLAAENACEETVELLVFHGAIIDLRSCTGTTPFYRAARGGSIRILSLLYNKGSEVDARTWDDWTPLMEAVENGHRSTVKLLLEWGADPLACTQEGSTPLSIACDVTETGIHDILKTAIEDLPRKGLYTKERHAL
jgi:amino acid transporter